jgi:hypothetical protein
MLGKVGFDRDLSRIDWQLKLRLLFSSFWRPRIPPLRSHLLDESSPISVAELLEMAGEAEEVVGAVSMVATKTLPGGLRQGLLHVELGLSRIRSSRSLICSPSKFSFRASP